MDSPGGKLLLDVRNHIIKRMPILAGAFIIGLVIGYPAASVGVEWLVSDATLAPDDTEIPVLSPVEFIAIKTNALAVIEVFVFPNNDCHGIRTNF